MDHVQILTLCIAHRTRIIDDVDGSSSKTIDEDDQDELDSAALELRTASLDAVAKFADFSESET